MTTIIDLDAWRAEHPKRRPRQLTTIIECAIIPFAIVVATNAAAVDMFVAFFLDLLKGAQDEL